MICRQVSLNVRNPSHELMVSAIWHDETMYITARVFFEEYIIQASFYPCRGTFLIIYMRKTLKMAYLICFFIRLRNNMSLILRRLIEKYTWSTRLKQCKNTIIQFKVIRTYCSSKPLNWTGATRFVYSCKNWWSKSKAPS